MRTVRAVRHRLTELASPTRLVATALIVLALGVGLSRLPGELRRQASAAASAARLPRVDGVPVLPPVGQQQTMFLALIRRVVPSGDAVRIVQPASATRNPLEDRHSGIVGVCGYQSAKGYFWAVYSIYPRPSTCDPQAPWTMYYGISPPALPRTATVYRTAPTLVLVRR